MGHNSDLTDSQIEAIERARMHLAERPKIIEALQQEAKDIEMQQAALRERLAEIEQLLGQLREEVARFGSDTRSGPRRRGMTWDELERAQLPDVPLPQRIIEELTRRPDQDAVSLAKSLGITDQKPLLHTTLSRMRKKGLIVAEGPSGSRTYRLARVQNAEASSTRIPRVEYDGGAA